MNKYQNQIKLMASSADSWEFSIKCAVCSFFANYVIGIFHPLELIKTRLQSHDGMQKNLVPRYTGILKGFRDIYRSEGMDGLYKGIHITMFTQAAANAIFFWIYEKRKLDYEHSQYSTMDATIYASTEASILCTLLTQPVWVIKTRVLLNTKAHIGQFENIANTMKEVWGQSRFRGFYSGLSMNLILSLTGVLSMYTYEGSKILYDNLFFSTYLGEKNFVCGALSKVITTFATYPFTTVRTRVQQNQFIDGSSEAKYRNSLDVIWKIAKHEGIAGFYKGVTPNILRGIPQRGLYFYFYELFKSWMNVGNME